MITSVLPLLLGCDVDLLHNQAEEGGGIMLPSRYLLLELDGADFSDNSPQDIDDSGAVYVHEDLGAEVSMTMATGTAAAEGPLHPDHHSATPPHGPPLL